MRHESVEETVLSHTNPINALVSMMKIVSKVTCVPANLCNSDDSCANGEYCKRPDGSCEGLGRCTTIPQICPLIYLPVCGCDGFTYSNTCAANAAGVNVADTTGGCQEPTPL
eukprot:TRINITY_DN10872_c0_g1_i1.p1 TRINITY_DN10872_c0_g1~~TRINITY_DN10872_c0_g1_i1.p1  ORF type:complete len:112 (-),score=1.70 TRINITY_DN10872_c0_g1_i1:28-363(-)